MFYLSIFFCNWQHGHFFLLIEKKAIIAPEQLFLEWAVLFDAGIIELKQTENEAVKPTKKEEVGKTYNPMPGR